MHSKMPTQRFPQEPQFSLSSSVFTQAEPHFEKPALQVKPHWLAWQKEVEFAGFGQAFSQRPQ